MVTLFFVLHNGLMHRCEANSLKSGLVGELLEHGLLRVMLVLWSSVHELYRKSLVNESIPPVADTGHDKWL